MTNNSSRSLKTMPPALPGLVYRSAVMHQLAHDIYRASRSQLPVLITGETGTGKELVARALHYFSPRSAKPFTPINSTALQPSLVEASLFGHKRGAFTGATDNALGIIRAAQGGTLLLDEIGDLALELQPKLLRFLQEGEVHVVGETHARKVNVRVLTATHQDLPALIAQRKFRADLYYRLCGIALHIPPLRDHKEDLPLLATHFLQEYSRIEGKPHLTLSPGALAALLRHNWPGNVRELRATIWQAANQLAPGETLNAQHLPAQLQPPLEDLDAVILNLFRRRPSTPAPQLRIPVKMKAKFEEAESLVPCE